MGAWWWKRSCSDRTHWKLPPGGHLVDRTPWGCAENTEPSAEIWVLGSGNSSR